VSFGCVRGLTAFAAPVNGKGLKVDDLRHEARPAHGERFLRNGRITFGRVDQLAARAVGELQMGRYAVGKGETPTHLEDRLRGDPERAAIKEETEVVEEMAHLADDAPSALTVVRVPVIGIQLASEDAVGSRLWARHGGQVALQGQAGWCEAPIES